MFNAQKFMEYPYISFFIARGLFFFGQFIVPGIFAQTQLAWEWFSFADTDFAALV